ncbi:ComEC/Rec2 family competence protein [Reinekea thalattae]|uniref:ComEC/Rec2 family competence protein n=1 Tax=Reinekea thalattae TaxID=2593301 RepID=UPI0016508ABD|nr:ComEC/Rec2 family competence protein [Reinekea thalattae]
MFVIFFLPLLPPVWYQFGLFPSLILIAATLLVSLFYYGRQRRFFSEQKHPYVLLVYALLASLMLIQLERQLQHPLPASLKHQTLPLTVCINRAVASYDDVWFSRARVVSQPAQTQLRNIQISLPKAKVTQPIYPGDCLVGAFRLRQPLGFLTPGGFDADRYYFSTQMDAKATLVDLYSLQYQPKRSERLYKNRQASFHSDSAFDIWAALFLGWSHSIDQDLKNTFSQNQLMHLFVVSGMHIGFISVFCLLLIKVVMQPWSSRLLLSTTVQYTLALLFVVLYVAFLGWPVPATRALIMLLVPFMIMRLAIRLNWLMALLVALAVLSLLKPEAWLSLGAWLSFISILIIIVLIRWQWMSLGHWLLRLFLFQCTMSLTTLPWAFLSGFSMNPFAGVLNFFITPLIGFLLLPLAFLIALQPMPIVVSVYEFVVQTLLMLLHWTQQFAFQFAWFSPLLVISVVALLVLFIWFVDRRLTSIVLLLVLLVSLIRYGFYGFAYRLPMMKTQAARVTLYDVGHGSSLLIEDQYGRWLVDTGGGLRSGLSYFQRDLDRQVGPLSGLIVTHADADHAMAVEYIMNTQAAFLAWSGQPERLAKAPHRSGFNHCNADTSPTPNMRFIAVPEPFRQSSNDHSCILLYQAQGKRMIITGDAGKSIEYFLLQAYPELFPLDIVVLGHHGSATSSSHDWLQANRGALYLVSNGDRLSPRWPAAAIVSWFDAHPEQQLLSTAQLGSIRLYFDSDGLKVKHSATAYRMRLIR